MGATGLRHSPAEGTTGGNRDQGRTQHVLSGSETWQKVGPSDLPQAPLPSPSSTVWGSIHSSGGCWGAHRGVPRGMRLCSHWEVLIIWPQSPPGYTTSPCQPQEQPCLGTGGTGNGRLALQRRGHAHCHHEALGPAARTPVAAPRAGSASSAVVSIASRFRLQAPRAAESPGHVQRRSKGLGQCWQRARAHARPRAHVRARSEPAVCVPVPALV